MSGIKIIKGQIDLPILISREDDKVVAEVPFFCIASQGANVEEAVEHLTEAVDLYFEGENVPQLIGTDDK